MAETPKPCPFCGGSPTVSVGGNPGDERTGYNYSVSLICSNCRASKTIYSKNNKNGWCSENIADATARVVEAWNTRPSIEEP